MFLHHGTVLTLALATALAAYAQDPPPVIDRGLPNVNLNNVSGPVRSNVRWGWHDHGFLGDDFVVGRPGERWVIDSIRTWVVPGTAGAVLPHLGDFYKDVRLHFGKDDLTPVATAQLTEGSDETNSPEVRVSDTSENGALLYDDFGTHLRVWQIDFQHLNLTVEGGARYRFGVWGLGRPVPGNPDKKFMWYNHASNAGLSGNRHEGADGRMLLFDAAGRFDSEFNAEGNGWDKPADINVQVFAHRADARRTTTPGVAK